MPRVEPTITPPATPAEPTTFDDDGQPEPSTLEVEAMLKALDGQVASAAAGAMPPDDDTIDELTTIAVQADAVAVLEAGLPHALDVAPVNSKIVVAKSGAVLATPNGVELLPKSDPANALPEGARIQKFAYGEGFRYQSMQLSAVEGHLPTWHDTASGAIGAFLAHFHPRHD